MNGVTGRMGTNQHLERSIHAIMQEGGMKINDDLTLMPDPILTGRNENKLKALAAKYGIEKYTTDLQSVLDDPYYKIFFDSSTFLFLVRLLEHLQLRKILFSRKNYHGLMDF